MPSCNKPLPGTMLLYGVIRPQCVKIRCHFKRQTNLYRLLSPSVIRRTSEYHIWKQKAPISDINDDLRKSGIWLPYHSTHSRNALNDSKLIFSKFLQFATCECRISIVLLAFRLLQVRINEVTCHSGTATLSVQTGGIVILQWHHVSMLASNHRQPNCLYNNLCTLTKREHKNRFFKIYIWIQLVS